MCSIKRLPASITTVPQDKTKTVTKNNPEIKNTVDNHNSTKGNNETKHSVNVDPKLKNDGHSTKNVKILDNHEESQGHERGVLYKAKEEVVVKAGEKTIAKSSEKLLEKVIQKNSIKSW